jgi:hypothetical protein
LPGAGLVGELPTNALTRISTLRALVLAGNPGLSLPIGQACANLPRCAIGVTSPCEMPASMSLCNSLTTTMAPTTEREVDVREWRGFYMDTGGSGWAQCTHAQDNPCACDEDGRLRVACEGQDDGSVTKMYVFEFASLVLGCICCDVLSSVLARGCDGALVMICCGVICNAMLCCAVLCYSMLCCAVLRYSMLFCESYSLTYFANLTCNVRNPAS